MPWWALSPFRLPTRAITHRNFTQSCSQEGSSEPACGDSARLYVLFRLCGVHGRLKRFVKPWLFGS